MTVAQASAASKMGLASDQTRSQPSSALLADCGADRVIEVRRGLLSDR